MISQVFEHGSFFFVLGSMVLRWKKLSACWCFTALTHAASPEFARGNVWNVEVVSRARDSGGKHSLH
jgi:hypothetical protein